MSNALSIFNQLRPVTVGYDNIFDHFEKMFEDDFFKSPSVNYPPYNIVKTGENQYNGGHHPPPPSVPAVSLPLRFDFSEWSFSVEASR